MGTYVLTDEQEDDFTFANAGRKFEDYLKESLEAWKESAKTNRRTVLQKALKDPQLLNDDLVKEVIVAAKLQDHADLIIK